MTSQPKLAPERPAGEVLKESLVTTLRRTVRRSMVLQVLRLRVVAATDRFRSTSGPPEPPLQSYAANPAPRIPEGIELTSEAIAADRRRRRRRLARAPASCSCPRASRSTTATTDGYARSSRRPGGDLRRDIATERFAAALGGLGLPMVDLLPRAARGEGGIGPLLPGERPPHAARPPGRRRRARPIRSGSPRPEPRLTDGLQLPALRLVLHRRLRRLPRAARTAARTGCCSSSSYYFYAAWDWRFLGLLAASTVVDYTAARLLESSTDARRRRIFVAVSLGFNLTLLGFFKYFNFFADSLQALFTGMGMPLDFVTAARPAARRDLVLHVRDDELRHRRVPPRDPGRRATS